MLAQGIQFLQQLQHFQYHLDTDPTWQIIFSNGKRKWYHLQISYYDGVYYIYDLINNYTIGIDPLNKKIEPTNEQISFTKVVTHKEWAGIFTLANNWLQKVAADWITTNAFVLKNYPLIYRKGTVPSAIIQNYFGQFKKLHSKVGSRSSKLFCMLAATNKIGEYDNKVVEKLCVTTYFEYCKIAYSAIGVNVKNISGKKLYETYADNRHEGLLDIDPDSEKEFTQWIDKKHPKRTSGGHPWEIMRGGNVSNIQLNVHRPLYGDKSKFVIEIYPTGNSRLAETIKMFLAIYKAGLPINITNAVFIRQQLLSLDNYAIIPEYESLHRANQQFAKEEKISEIMHWYSIKKQQAKILPFITWKPLPLLQPTSYNQ